MWPKLNSDGRGNQEKTLGGQVERTSSCGKWEEGKWPKTGLGALARSSGCLSVCVIR